MLPVELSDYIKHLRLCNMNLLVAQCIYKVQFLPKQESTYNEIHECLSLLELVYGCLSENGYKFTRISIQNINMLFFRILAFLKQHYWKFHYRLLINEFNNFILNINMA